MSLTIKDIARIANVSPATVSRVLNNKKEVNEDTRKKIRSVIDKHDYHPSIMARNIIKKRSNCIGLIILNADMDSTFINPFNSEMIHGVFNEAKVNSYHIILSSYVNVSDYRAIYSLYKEKRVEGFIILGSNVRGIELYEKLNQDKIPYVATTKVNTEQLTSFIDVDNFSGGELVTNHLISLGHKEIAILATADLYVSHNERLLGYKAALKANNLHLNKEYIFISSDYTEESGFHEANKLLQLKKQPTAIFATGDLLAIGVVRAIKNRGLSIPGDYSIVGFDDIYFSQDIEPPLTTVRQPGVKKGVEACKILIESFDNEILMQGKILPVEMIIRKSVRSLK